MEKEMEKEFVCTSFSIGPLCLNPLCSLPDAVFRATECCSSL